MIADKLNFDNVDKHNSSSCCFDICNGIFSNILACYGYSVKSRWNNKQLLDEVEHDIMNYQNRGLCYLPKPKAEADNTDTRFW